MKRIETFAEALNDYLGREGVSEREFINRNVVHPRTFAELFDFEAEYTGRA
jgi:hypothetical protein